MMTFSYRAARSDGEIVRGVVKAETAQIALDAVASRGLFAFEVHEADDAPLQRLPAGAGELALALSGLAALLEAGLPVDRALDAAQETVPARLAAALRGARDQVREGATLAAALQTAHALPPLAIAVIGAGERSGNLTGSLRRAAADLDHAAQVRDRLQSALTYPAILAVAGASSSVAIVAFVVPRFASLLADQGRELPGTTRVLLHASSFAVNYGVAVLAATVVSAAALVRWCRGPSGQASLSGFLHSLPVVGPIRRQLAAARVCGALAAVTEAGVPILSGLDLARTVAGDAVTTERMARVRDDVERGERLGTALRRHAALTPLAMRLAGFGESAGRLSSFLAHAAAVESAAAQERVRRLVTLLEPILILGFGIFVALIAAALLQAVYAVRPSSF